MRTNYSTQELLTMIAQKDGLLPYNTAGLPVPGVFGHTSNPTPTTPWEVFCGFIGGVVVGGISVAPAIVFFMVLFIMPRYFGFVWTGSDAQIEALLYSWLGLTIFSGLFTAWATFSLSTGFEREDYRFEEPKEPAIGMTWEERRASHHENPADNAS